MDRIHIEDLLLRCIIGVNPEERREKQDVCISVTLLADLRQAGASDNLEHTVDYRAIKLQIRDFVEHSSFLLVERLAEGIAAICLAAPRVEKAIIRVEKPGALRFARTVAVEVERSRGDVAPSGPGVARA